VSPDGTKVYVAIFDSGNSSTILGGALDQSGASRPTW
jgi:DNA-binding beta-propeller fold protein YncE